MTATTTPAADVPRPFRDVPKVTRMLLSILGRSAKELGAVSGLTESQMSYRLSGKSPIKVSELIQWADHLGVDPALFFVNPAELRNRLLNPANSRQPDANRDTIGLTAERAKPQVRGHLRSVPMPRPAQVA